MVGLNHGHLPLKKAAIIRILWFSVHDICGFKSDFKSIETHECICNANTNLHYIVSGFI